MPDNDGLRLRRNDDGQLVPVEAVTPTLGIEIKVIPMTYGQSRSYESFGEALHMWTAEEKARLLSENLVEADGEEFGEVTAEELEEDFEAWTIEDVVQGIAMCSGLQRLFEQNEGEGKAPDVT